MENMQINLGTKKSKFLKWILAAGILVVMNLLFAYGIRTFYAVGPNYDDYCPSRYEPVPMRLVGGDEPLVERTEPENPKIDYDKCNRDYRAAQALYNRNAFVIMVVLGVLAIGASFIAASAEAVSLGFSLGGVLALIVGTIRYWSDMDDKLRFSVLLVGFIALVWLGIKKIRD